MTPTSPAGRRHDLDWLRVLAFCLLVPYHTGMFFVSWGWHVKNPELSTGAMEVAMFFVAQWRLALLFLVSGAGVRFALRRRTAGEFARERMQRLLLPLLFGMAVVVPPQVYYERLTQGAAYGSYLDFLPHAFRGVYPEGNLSWHHLWFVAYVLVFALAALPLFLWLRGERGRRFLERLGALWSRPGAILLPILLPIATEMALRPAWPSTHNLIADWANLATYGSVFVLGYLLFAEERFADAAMRARRWTLACGVFTSTALIVAWRGGLSPSEVGYTAHRLLWIAAAGLNAWLWLLTLLGHARRHLTTGSPLLTRANEAVYPFYILHQTVTVALAYHAIPWQASVPVKFTAICLGTFAVTGALYALVQATAPTRLLFGMRPVPGAARADAPSSVPAGAHQPG